MDKLLSIYIELVLDIVLIVLVIVFNSIGRKKICAAMNESNKNLWNWF